MKTPAIEVENLSVKFGEFVALTEINFKVPEGGFLAILGPNGAGKSTLIKTLIGLVEPTSGSALILGKAPHDHDASTISYVPQLKTIDRQFPALAVELVVSGQRRSWPWRVTATEREQAIRALDKVGMANVADTSIAHLSGGQLQRVYLARGLVRDPRVVVLDEPATGIDATGEAELYHLLEHYQADHHATVLMITHDWAVARHHATDVLLLNRRQVGFGHPDEILRDSFMREAYGHTGHSHPMSVGGT